MNEDKLKVMKANAVKAYEAADTNGKILLEKLFPGVLKPVLITDRIKTFQDVLAYHNLTNSDFEDQTENDADDEVAYKQVKLVARALNELKPGEELDRSQPWYTPYFDRRAGFGFSRTRYDYWHTYTIVGSRLSYKSANLAIYAGKTFTSIYERLMRVPSINQSNQ